LPLYEYQCQKCHSLTERIQKFSDPPLAVCPHCGGELEQLISAPAVRFKGSGWYVTDYAKKSSGGGSSSGNGSSSSSGAEGKSSAEDKGETSKSAGASSREKAGSETSNSSSKKRSSDKSNAASGKSTGEK
jgi:putative FmdB family regulatory protein